MSYKEQARFKIGDLLVYLTKTPNGRKKPLIRTYPVEVLDSRKLKDSRESYKLKRIRPKQTKSYLFGVATESYENLKKLYNLTFTRAEKRWIIKDIVDSLKEDPNDLEAITSTFFIKGTTESIDRYLYKPDNQKN